VTKGDGDEDWISETLARAVLDEDSGPGSSPEPPRPTPPATGLFSRPASADVGRSAVEPPAPSPSASEGPAGPLGPSERVIEPPTGTDEAADADEPVRADDEHRRIPPVVRSAIEWVVVIVGALVVALILRTLLFQAFFIPSESMEPTLRRDDRVLVNKVSYRLHDVNRGDVVVFRRPPGPGPAAIQDLIKRVVALEGETISASEGRIEIDGMILGEPYLPDGTRIADFGPVTVPAGHVFVMGDNRGNSQDSRVFGPIPEDDIVGRAFVLFWPVNRFGAL
jgi:signal peptidase I